MNTAGWALVFTGAGGAFGWTTYIARLIWLMSSRLQRLTDLMAQESNTQRLIEQRLDRHLDWHDRH